MSEDQVRIPDEFICPITRTIMNNPYMDRDGNSFEKEAIMDWLKVNSVSPVTRNPMTIDSLSPNRSLQSLIEGFKAEHPELCGTVAKEKNSHYHSGKGGLTPREARAELGRKPLILYAVIDVSGSMQNPCDDKPQHLRGGPEDDSFCRLDLVKHTLNTIISSLTKHDRICIIKFSTAASVFIPLTSVAEESKAALIRNVNDLQPEGQTNIWDGMRVAIDEAAALQASLETDAKAESQVDDLNVHIYLLTDGEPTINPPGPIDSTILAYLGRKCRTLQPTISTFGYGYQLDSDMLFKVAQVSGQRPHGQQGIFGFIPDASMVGTVFINALANSLHQRASGSDFDHFTAATASMREFYEDLLRGLASVLVADISVEERNRQVARLLEQAQAMLRQHGHEPPIPSQQKTHELITAFLQGLVRDLTPTSDPSLGQVHKAIQADFFKKWGVHYLRSVLTAFQTKQCGNFKDQAMQIFQTCSPQLVDERGRIEDIFLSLPAPTPSLRRGDYYGPRGGFGGGGGAPAAPAAPVDMRRYLNASGGCFGKDSLIMTPNGKSVPVSALRPGTEVCSEKGRTRVLAVVKAPFTGLLIHIGCHLALTAFHPVRIGEKEAFPTDLVACPPRGVAVRAEQIQDGEVFNIVLEDRGLVRCVVDGAQECVAATLGHDCRSVVFTHAYFGSEKVVQDLQHRFRASKEKDIWALSVQDHFIRDPASGLVCGLSAEGDRA